MFVQSAASPRQPVSLQEAASIQPPARKLPPAGRLAFLMLGLLLCLPAGANAQVVRSGAGANAAAIQPVVDAFRAELGQLRPNVAGTFCTGRREINWDGVPNAFAAPNDFPADFFNVNSPRGVVYQTPGSGFQVSSNAAVGNVEFDNLNPTYSETFAVFSPQRLFTALGSTINQVDFFIPGTTVPALTTGFGAVFTDVDEPASTKMECFDRNGNLLFSGFAPNVPGGSETLSFLGVSFSEPVIARVVITSGEAAPSAANFDTAADIVVMDDFIYGEPTDATPPTVDSSLVRSSLWPPNHELVDVGLAVAVRDDLDTTLNVQIEVFSNEADGTGGHSPDAVLGPGGTLLLRSEREGGNKGGRVYLIRITAVDDCGNVGRACRTVVVPHDQSGRSVATANAQAAAARAHCEANGTPPSGFVRVGEP